MIYYYVGGPCIVSHYRNGVIIRKYKSMFKTLRSEKHELLAAFLTRSMKGAFVQQKQARHNTRVKRQAPLTSRSRVNYCSALFAAGVFVYHAAGLPSVTVRPVSVDDG